MAIYLIDAGSGFSIQKVKGFTPANSIAIVTDSIPVADYPYVIGQQVDDGFGNLSWKAVVDQAAKTAGDAAKLTQETVTKWSDLRAQRDALLTACDFSQLPDAPLTAQQVTAYQTYRQELRDLPANTVDIDAVVFPTKPV